MVTNKWTKEQAAQWDHNNLANAPAFPQRVDEPNGIVIYDFGLTKREYFAAMAMQGLLSDPSNYGYSVSADNTANISLEMADALIKALNKPKP